MQNSGNGFVHTSRRLPKQDHRGKGWFSGPRFIFVLRGAAALFEFLKLFRDADVSIFLNKTGSGAHRWQAGFNLCWDAVTFLNQRSRRGFQRWTMAAGEGGVRMVSASPAGIDQTHLIDQCWNYNLRKRRPRFLLSVSINCLRGRIPGLLNGFKILQICNLK